MANYSAGLKPYMLGAPAETQRRAPKLNSPSDVKRKPIIMIALVAAGIMIIGGIGAGVAFAATEDEASSSSQQEATDSPTSSPTESTFSPTLRPTPPTPFPTSVPTGPTTGTPTKSPRTSRPTRSPVTSQPTTPSGECENPDAQCGCSLKTSLLVGKCLTCDVSIRSSS